MAEPRDVEQTSSQDTSHEDAEGDEEETALGLRSREAEPSPYCAISQ